MRACGRAGGRAGEARKGRAQQGPEASAQLGPREAPNNRLWHVGGGYDAEQFGKDHRLYGEELEIIGNCKLPPPTHEILSFW